MTMSELDAVAATLPAKKRHLRETFERLAASSPAPLPFRWEDLDTYISSLQYSVTLRSRQLRALQAPRPAPAPAPAVVPAPAATVGDHEKGKKRKASGVEVQIQVEEDAVSAANMASLMLDKGGEGNNVSNPPIGGSGCLLEARASTVVTVQVDPICNIASVVEPLAATTHHVSNATNLVTAGASNSSLRRRPPRPEPAVTVGDVEKGKKRKVPRTKTEAVVGEMQMQEAVKGIREIEEDLAAAKNPSHNGGEAKVSPSPPGGGVGNGHASKDVTLQMAPICKVAGFQQGFLTASPHASNAGNLVPDLPAVRAPNATCLLLTKAPKLEPSEETAGVEMQVVEAEQQIQEVKKEDAPAAAKKPCPLQVKAQETNMASLAPLGNGNGLGEVSASAGTTIQADAACKSAGVRQELPTVTCGTRQAPNLGPGSGPNAERVNPSLSMARNARNHVLQQQHVAKEHSEPVSLAKKQKQSFSRNHGGRPTVSQNVLQAQAAAQRLNNKRGPGRGGPTRGELAAGRGLQGNNSRNKNLGKGKPQASEPCERSKNPNQFCNRC